MNKQEKCLKSNKIYEGKIIKVFYDDIVLPNGKPAYREYVIPHDGASILAIDNDENIYLVKQFRYPFKEEILEIPAGKLDDGENPLEGAIRELQEETGFVPDSIEDYGCMYITPGYSKECLYVFKARVSQKGETNFDEDEFLDLIKMPIQQAFELVQQGVIKDGKSVYAICRYMAEKND